MRFDYTNAFLAGFRSQETLPSATNCTMYLEQSILNYNETLVEWDELEQEQAARDANPDEVPVDA